MKTNEDEMAGLLFSVDEARQWLTKISRRLGQYADRCTANEHVGADFVQELKRASLAADGAVQTLEPLVRMCQERYPETPC